MKPRVVFLFDSLASGGAQHHVVGLMQSLSDRFDIFAVSCRSDVSVGLFPPRFQDRAKGLGITGFTNPAAWLRLAHAVAELKPDLLVGVNQVAGVLAVTAKRLGVVSAPCAVAFHSTQIGSLAGWIRTLPFCVAVWVSDALVYVSRNQASLWKRRGLRSRRTLTIVNGIDVNRFPARTLDEYVSERARLGFTADDYVIGLCAAFRPEKNHAQLIRAIASMRANGLQAKALLIGDGPSRGHIEQLVQDAGLTEHISFAGHRSIVRPLLAALDVGVLTSTRIETLSLSALEIMSTGVPMVLSEIGGASEVVEDGVSGFLFPAGDDVALIDRLTKLADPAIRSKFGNASRERVEEHFDHRIMSEAHARLFHDLISAAKARK